MTGSGRPGPVQNGPMIPMSHSTPGWVDFPLDPNKSHEWGATLAGWWLTYPSENMKVSWTSWTNIWKNNPKVPNHQPGDDSDSLKYLVNQKNQNHKMRCTLIFKERD